MARNPNKARHHEWHAADGSIHELLDLPQGIQLGYLPDEADKKDAVPTDPTNCVLARCASRLAGGLPAQVGRDKAMIPAIINGRQAMWRCKVPRATKRAVEHYDDTGEFPEGGFLFKGISPSETLDSQRSQNKRRRERWGSERGHSGQQRQQPLRNASRRAQVFVSEETE